MASFPQTPQISRARLWTGRVISILITLFMLFDCLGHFLKPAPVVQAFAQLGFPLRFSVPLAIVELACVALYVMPRTAILGAILLTGYLGGAIATQLRAGSPLFSVAFPVILGALIWGGLFLRDERIRALLLRK